MNFGFDFGGDVTQKIPLATFADLKEALFLLQYSNDVRPYVLQWYYDVFLPTYKEKTDVDSKPSSDGRYMLKESRIAVTTQQLAYATFNKKDKKISTRYVREIYLEQLINQGYIDSVSSELDKRTEIYFPVIEPKERRHDNYHINKNSINLPPYIQIPGLVIIAN